MTRRVRRHHPLVWMAAGTAVLLGGDAIAWLAWVTLHLLVFLVLPAITGLVAYQAGRRRGPSQTVSHKAPLRTRYGTVQGTVLPPPPPGGPDPADAAVRRDVRSGLANLGWPASTTGAAVDQALAAVRASGGPVTTPAVLAAVLREAGNRKFSPSGATP